MHGLPNLKIICSYFGFVIRGRIKIFQKRYFYDENKAKSVDQFYLSLSLSLSLYKVMLWFWSFLIP